MSSRHRQQHESSSINQRHVAVSVILKKAEHNIIKTTELNKYEVLLRPTNLSKMINAVMMRRILHKSIKPRLFASSHDFPGLPFSHRSHTTERISPLLPLTKDEPHLPKSDIELQERIRPLADLWGIEASFLNADTPLFRLDKNQLLSILTLPLPGESGWGEDEVSSILKGLYTMANSVCTKHHGDKVHYRGLLEFSNICRSNCNYCGIRRSMKLHERYTLDEDTIMEVAKWSADRGYGSIMLQSGEVSTKKRVDFVSKVIRRIVEETGMGVSISVGELPDRYYQQLKEAGAKRYLLRIETSNPELFAKLHPPNQTFEKRLDRLRSLRRHGYMVGTGVMIGLPSQTREDLAEDLLFFAREDVDMIGMGPYIFQRGTPVGDWWEKDNPLLSGATRQGDNATPEQIEVLDKHAAAMFELTTRMVALARITMGDVNVAATTALQTIHPTGREVALMRGANIMMPILTPTIHRANYQLYEGKVCIDESAKQCRSCLELRVGAAGKRIAYGEQGDPPHATRRLKDATASN